MRRFFRIGKGKKEGSDTASNVSSRRSSTASLAGAVGGYEIRDKDLGKIHKAIVKKDLEKVRRLASKESNALDKESRTALHLAAAFGYDAAIQELMQWKITINAKDREGKTPLYKAIENRHENCARMLLDARADPTIKDSGGNSSLHCTAKAGMFDLFKDLKRFPKVTPQELSHANAVGETPLHLAAIAKSISICKFIINNGGNIDAQDSKGFTALMWACQSGSSELVSLLLEHNADTSIKDANGWTADDIALNNAQTACREAILQHQSQHAFRPDSHIYSSAGSTSEDDDDEDGGAHGKPASNVQEVASDDDNATGDHRANGGLQSVADLKSWSDSESVSEIEVKNKKSEPLEAKGALLKNADNVMNNLVGDDDNEQSDDEMEGSNFPSQTMKDKNKGFIYNNMAKNLNVLLEKDDANDTKQTNQRPNASGLQPASPVKNKSKPGNDDQTRAASPQSWASSDSSTTNTGKKNRPPLQNTKKLDEVPSSGKKKPSEDISDGEWTTEPSQPSQNPIPTRSQQENQSPVKPDNRQKAGNHGADEIYATVNKKKDINDKKTVNTGETGMLNELGLDDVEFDDSEATSHMASSLQSHDKMQKNIPISARSAISDWDSTVAEETPRESKPKATSPTKTSLKEVKSKASVKDKHEPDSPWDSDDGDNNDKIPELSEVQNAGLGKDDAASEDDKETDEDESSWEKERRLLKNNNLKKQKKESQKSVDQAATAKHFPAGEGKDKDIDTQRQPSKVEKLEQQVISTIKSAVAHKENDLELSNASSMSSQLKGLSRVRLASASSKMSFDESVSEADDQLSPRNTTVRSISLNTDMNNVIRLQELVRDGQRKLETERSAKTLLENKRKTLENEREKLVEQLQVVTKEKFTLDQVKIDLQSKVRDLEYRLTEEIDKRKNIDILCEKTKEQLTRKEKQILELTESKQMTETSLKNELKEKTSALAVAKQLEEENQLLKKQLNEKNIFVVQEEYASRNQRSIIQSGISLNDENLQLMPSYGTSPEIYAAQLKISHQKERTKDDFEQLFHENEQLQKHNKELAQKLSYQEDALTHASLQYNIGVDQLKADNDRLNVQSGKESVAKEELVKEVNSLKLQLSSINIELQAALEAKAEAERQRKNLANELDRTAEKGQQELFSTKSLYQSQSDQLTQVLPKLQKLEGELVIANTILTERTAQLSSLQKDLDKNRSSREILDETNAKLKEENIRLEAKVELLLERLSEAQKDLQAMRSVPEGRDANGDRPDDITILLNNLKAEHDRAKSHLDDKNASLVESLSKVKEELKVMERSRINVEDEKRRLQTSLSEVQKQLLASEATVEMTNQLKQQLDMERSQLKSEIDRLKDRMEDDRKKIFNQEQKILELTQQLKMAENSAATGFEQLNKKSNSLQGLLKAKADLEGNFHKMDVENARLEAALTHERQKFDMLQRDYNESKQNNNHLENECEKLKSSNAELQFLINEAAGLKTQATQDADDNRALWESEIRSRSKLGLRLAQLEREKRELDTKVLEEKRRVRRALELKKSTDSKLEEEQERNSQLQKEVSALKVYLKAAKKRMKLDHVKRQLHRDSESKDYGRGRSSTLATNHVQNSENIHLNGFHHDQLPLKFQTTASNYAALSDVDRISEMLKTEAQMELNQKLQEVNRYLDDQAKARERLDRIRSIGEVEMKNEFEKVRREMLEEIAKVKHSFEEYVEGQTHPIDNEAQQQMIDLHDRERKLRGRLMARLDNAYSKVSSSNLDYLHPVAFDQEVDALMDEEFSKINVRHGSNDLILNNLRQQLDKSISRHMAAAATSSN